MSQFAFLKAEFPDIFSYAARGENLAHTDPRAAAFYVRLAVETAVLWLFRHDRTLKDPGAAVDRAAALHVVRLVDILRK